MTDQTKELLEQITQLKSRVLDTQDASVQAQSQAQAQIKELSDALQSIAQLLGLSPDESGNLSLEAIVNSVADSLKSEDAVESDPAFAE